MAFGIPNPHEVLGRVDACMAQMTEMNACMGGMSDNIQSMDLNIVKVCELLQEVLAELKRANGV